MLKMKRFPMVIVVPALIVAAGVAARPEVSRMLDCEREDTRGREMAIERSGEQRGVEHMGCVSGTVKDVDGNPMAGVVVQATFQGTTETSLNEKQSDNQRDNQQREGQQQQQRPGVQWQHSATSDTTDADGAFRILNLRPGHYRIALERHQADPQTVEIKEGEEKDGVEFEVRSMTGSR